MPPALQGTASTGAAKATGTSPRSDAQAGDTRRDFDALLNGDAASTAKAPTRPAGKAGNAGTADGSAKSGTEPNTPATADAPKRPGRDTATEATADAGTTEGSAATKPAAQDSADDTEPAPWPPLGLAGLALAGTPPQLPPALQPATAAATDADPLLATAAPLPTPALPLAAAAAGAATATEPAAALVLPADATVADDPALLKAVTDALAGADNGDAPATPLLHALHAATELKSSTVTAAFTGNPTATPDVGADDFGDAMSARIGWLADQKIGHAVIRVTPHDLGQIEVRLQIDGDKVHASFSSAHAEVRHALETSLPRLREMLGEQGFQLGNADVGQQHTAQGGQDGNGQPGATGGDGEPTLADITVSPAQLMRQRGLVDAYA
ncbi:flagellar hook-length control protein FliK [Stenotrophomonas rhizophila]|uniref:flagellar hook-length control protein FliK n=1 Tax=Stenotrophomonas rhizophila TaxID=216778 RepID=UPI003715FAAD